MLNQEEKKKLIEYIDSAEYFKSKGDYNSAISCYENFLKIDSQTPAVYSILANLYEKEYGDESLEKQIYCYDKLLSLNPSSRLAMHGLAFCYEKLHRNTNAEKYYKLLLENSPSDVDYYNYGMFLIHNGDFINGHKYFTKRFNISDNPALQYPISLNKKWDFQTDISAKTLLVHYEQGFGDTIMYCRFIPELKKICKKLIFVVQNELYDLISESKLISDGIEIVSNADGVHYDYSMALLDAPYALHTTLQTIPYVNGYLSSAMNEYGGEFKIGIAYSGDKNANYDSRNIDIEKFCVLSELAGVKLYSLQKTENKILPLVSSLGYTFKTFSDTARAVKAMDLIISTDNVILNLSGALGVKTIGLFNYQTNYRWYKTTGENVGWYTSVKPLQCSYENNWDEVFEQLSKIIKTELTSHS